MTDRSSMPAEHAILGLLALEGGEGHGYDLARYFADGRPLAAVLRLEVGMLYHHLKKLARAGWVAPVPDAERGRPPRQVYTLTTAGRDELRRWLAEPVGHTREIRLEFLVKLYFARRLDAALAEVLLADQLARLRDVERGLERQLAEVEQPSPAPGSMAGDDPAFARLVLDLRLVQTRAAIAWMERATAVDTPDRR
jgi:DNA-binding PadR family transcriptional regulator